MKKAARQDRHLMAKVLPWRKWYTRLTATQVNFGSWGFKSPREHTTIFLDGPVMATLPYG